MLNTCKWSTEINVGRLVVNFRDLLADNRAQVWPKISAVLSDRTICVQEYSHNRIADTHRISRC